jgi:N-acetylornithine carbamoyltransferase
MKRFLDLADFSREEILDLLALARHLEQHPEPRALAGKILGLVFFNPSLRTLASFQVGMMKLGGSSFVITPGQGTWQLESRLGAVMNGAAAEHIREGLPVLASYADALGIRAFAEGKDLRHDLAETNFKAMAGVVDWKTLDDIAVPQRAKFVLSWANHPRVTPIAVPAATVHMAAQRGMEVVVLRPEGFALPPEIMDKARAAAAASGGSVRETQDRSEALAGAHVLYAKEWGSITHYGDSAGDAALRANLADWCVREDWFTGAAADCKFMHCLPVRRNVAVADEVLDGPRSIVLREAHNRLTAQMAVLHRLLA